jgi:Reverse transcriptase (RNA-dependent DNA polymerase)
MHKKRRIHNQEVYKWKCRLNLGGHCMKHGIHFDETYSPVVPWSTIRLFLILATVSAWHTMQIDFVMAYTQAAIARTTYMELPPGKVPIDSRYSTIYMGRQRICKNLVPAP